MAILDKAKGKKPVKTTDSPPVKVGNSDKFSLSIDELEFLIRMIGEGTFKGNNIMFIYDLVKKLQDEYLTVKNGGNG